jgi:Flp pilus assembly secretin CpaC
MQTLQSKLLKQVSICAFIIALIPAAAQAQDLIQQDMMQGEAIDILPARGMSDDAVTVTNNDATHPMLRLTPDRSELVRLDQDASTVVIGNPAHLSVMVDTSRTLVLVPKLPGATHFSVLDGKGNVIMQRHVIVASPKQHYVRVRRACASSGEKVKENGNEAEGDEEATPE